MVRRRSASPRPSAPVRTARSPPPASSVPTQRTAPHAPPPPASQGGGFLSQMAATAGGVAIGSTVGHALGGMFSGSKESEAPQAVDNSQQYNKQQPQEMSHPCEFEWQQFLSCAQNQSDVGVCQSFNDIFKQCQSRYAGQR